MTVIGLLGYVSDIPLTETPLQGSSRIPSAPGSDTDLVDMARWAMEALRDNTRPGCTAGWTAEPGAGRRQNCHQQRLLRHGVLFVRRFRRALPLLGKRELPALIEGIA